MRWWHGGKYLAGTWKKGTHGRMDMDLDGGWGGPELEGEMVARRIS